MERYKKLYRDMHVRVEAPRPVGNDTEFFLQRHEKNTVATLSHVHNAIELIYVNEGEYKALIDGKEFELSPSDLLLIPSNNVHYVSTSSSDAHSYYVMKIPPSALLESMSDGFEDSVFRFCEGSADRRMLWRSDELQGSRILSVIERMKEEYHSSNPASAFVIRLEMLLLLVEILREDEPLEKNQHGEMSTLIYTVLRYVSQHFAEEIDEREIAARIGVSYGYFVRAFRSVVGMSFRKYLNMVRINRARQMLLTGDGNVSSVALACGYNSVSYFISLYRSEKGETPKDTYKNRVNKDLYQGETTIT